MYLTWWRTFRWPQNGICSHQDAKAGSLISLRPFDELLCGCQVTNTRVLFFSYDSIRSPTKERLAAIRGTAHGRHTDLGYVPLLGTMPRDLCLKDRTVRSCQSLPVLHVVESFPGAPSPLGSKEPNQLFFSRHRVFVASRPQRFAH